MIFVLVSFFCDILFFISSKLCADRLGSVSFPTANAKHTSYLAKKFEKHRFRVPVVLLVKRKFCYLNASMSVPMKLFYTNLICQ